MIFLITGVMASGKSTVAELLAQRFVKSVHLRGDIFRKMIVSGCEEMSATPSSDALLQLDLRYRLTTETAKRYHEAGFTVIMQDNYYGEKLAYVLELLAPEPVQAIVLCPGAEVVRQREAARGKTGYHGFSVESLHESFMQNTPRIGLWIDNGNQTPEETVDEILRGTGAAE
ncbi:AAA family ATPase [Synergistaceae bacterium OttesenSCG-928-D05]|nr:AAA family ATPase [Synergistaceae bacterium OttesenSCG-928-D05]